MARISKAQAYGKAGGKSGDPDAKKILEINPSHPIIKELLERVKGSSTPDQETEDLAKMLVDTSLVNSGYTIDKPSDFSKRFYSMFYGALGVPKDSPIEEIEVADDEEDEEEAKKENKEEADDEDDDEDEERKAKEDL